MQVHFICKNGGDKLVVDAARVSYGGGCDAADAPLTEADVRLIAYLARHKHMSPFRHPQITLLFDDIPEFVARQAQRHMVGARISFVDLPFNEVSGRYVELGETMWKGPTEEWRGVPAKGQSKQGSTAGECAKHTHSAEANAVAGTISACGQVQAQELYEAACKQAMQSYRALLHLGVCREQARAVLPLAFCTKWYWTLSLEAAAHFCQLRLAADAQLEIRELAQLVDALLVEHFPVAYAALRENVE